jgi:hypothetical protein
MRTPLGSSTRLDLKEAKLYALRVATIMLMIALFNHMLRSV